VMKVKNAAVIGAEFLHGIVDVQGLNGWIFRSCTNVVSGRESKNSPPPLAHRGSAMVRDDGEKPRPGLAGIAQTIERPPCLHGRLLYGVMRLVRITQHRDRKPIARLDPGTDGR